MLIDMIKTEMVAAQKAQNAERLGTLRLIKDSLDKKAKSTGKPLDEAGEMQVLETMAKQRRDSIDQFTKGHRLDLVQCEAAELALIEGFLPVSATEADVHAAITLVMLEMSTTQDAAFEPGPATKQMGVVMKGVKAALAGKRVDGKMLSEAVKSALTAA